MWLNVESIYMVYNRKALYVHLFYFEKVQPLKIV